MGYPGPKQSLARAARTAPRTWTTTTCSRAKPWAGRRAGQEAEGHIPSPRRWPCLVQPYRPDSPAQGPSSSLRLQRHSTLWLPRSTLGVTTDTTHSRNTPVIFWSGEDMGYPGPKQSLVRAARTAPSTRTMPQATSISLGWQSKASHPQPRLHADRSS